MSQYVYILSDYEEHGAKNVTATLDRARLNEVMSENWPEAHFKHGGREEWLQEARTKLEDLLQETDEELAETERHNLHHGWGGMQFHVVKLK